MRILGGAAAPVQIFLVFALLAAAMVSALIFRKAAALRCAEAQVQDFERQFWSGGDLTELAARLEDNAASALAAVFRAGFREFGRLARHGAPAHTALACAQRAMQAERFRVLARLRAQTSALALVGAAGCYLGLLAALLRLVGALLGPPAQAVSGIAGALLLILAGLCLGAPPIIACSRFAARIDRLADRIDVFTAEFGNVLAHHQAGAIAAKPK